MQITVTIAAIQAIGMAEIHPTEPIQRRIQQIQLGIDPSQNFEKISQFSPGLGDSGSGSRDETADNGKANQ